MRGIVGRGRTIAGVVDSERAGTLVFALFVGDVPLDDAAVTTAIDSALVALYEL